MTKLVPSLRHRTVFLTVVLTPMLLYALLWWPRNTPPLQPPALSLARDAVAAQLTRDQQLAASLPDSPIVDELQAAFLENGRAELQPFVDAQALTQRLAKVKLLLANAKKQHGDGIVPQLRAAATEHLAAILQHKITGDEKDARLGVFPNLLDRHHATHKGLPIAPEFVIRTLYKARFNTLHGLQHADGFSPIEGQAYFGWLALHATLPLRQRLQAIPEYEAAGGARVDEAAGVLLYLAGHFEESAAALARAYDKHPSLRLRNYLAGARAQLPSGG